MFFVLFLEVFGICIRSEVPDFLFEQQMHVDVVAICLERTPDQITNAQ